MTPIADGRRGADDTDLALGLISGTSMDGIDAALVACGRDPLARPYVLAFHTVPYHRELRERLLACADSGTAAQVARLDVAVGEAFADAALGLLAEVALSAADVRCIGSHGQTLVHLPDAGEIAGHSIRASLQIGQPAVIAARTGIVTVADFRAMDLALGGQGAPLVPLLDWRCYRRSDRGRVLLNLGGIANLTALPPDAGPEAVVAFDTGPANVLLDAAARLRGIPDGFDRGGELAASGRVDEELLGWVLAHPFLDRPPPKSADTGDFLGDWGEALWTRAAETSTIDLMATLAAATAASVAGAVECWVRPAQPVDEVLVSGGGLHNRAVMAGLRARLGVPCRRLPDEEGIPPDAKEAAAFALLALETLAGRPGNLPGATGARGPASLGAVVRPPTE